MAIITTKKKEGKLRKNFKVLKKKLLKVVLILLDIKSLLMFLCLQILIAK